METRSTSMPAGADRHSSDAVLLEKVRLYSDFIVYLNDIHGDGRPSPAELNTLMRWMLRISLLVSDLRVVGMFHEYLFQILAFRANAYDRLKDAEKGVWKHWHRTYVDGSESGGEYGDEAFCRRRFVTASAIVAALRDDLLYSRAQVGAGAPDMREAMERLLELSGVVAVKIGERDITFIHDLDGIRSRAGGPAAYFRYGAGEGPLFREPVPG